jgi:hypothetical protein
MRGLITLALLALVCGCLEEAANTTTTATIRATAVTIEDDFVYSAPTTSAPTTTTAACVPTTSSIRPDDGGQATTTTLNPLIRTFKDNGGAVCRVDGLPVIRMFGKSDCEHCAWGGPIFDKVAGEYAGSCAVVAHHWVFGLDDDALTAEDEGSIPESETDVFYGSNQTTVPYYSFGCRFTRTGNGYYVRNRPDLEEEEFRAVIEQLKTTQN